MNTRIRKVWNPASPGRSGLFQRALKKILTNKGGLGLNNRLRVRKKNILRTMRIAITETENGHGHDEIKRRDLWQHL